jgi:hypothetical protein
MSVCKLVLGVSSAGYDVIWFAIRRAYIDLPVLEPLLQIVVDGFIRDLTYQSEIRNSHLLLLRGIESGLLDIRFTTARCRSSSTSILGFLPLVALRSSTDPLVQPQISNLNRAKKQ